MFAVEENDPSAYWQDQMKHEPTKSYYETLVYILGSIEPKKALEIGTGWGISGAAFVDSGVEHLVSVDPNLKTNYGRLAKEEIEKRKKNNQTVRFLTAWSPACFKEFVREKFDIIYIDGAHDYEAVTKDLEAAKDCLAPDGVIILDDALHINNYDPSIRDRNGDPDPYGIMWAARDFMVEHGWRASLVPTLTNGFLILRLYENTSDN